MDYMMGLLLLGITAEKTVKNFLTRKEVRYEYLQCTV
jgi:hypothetical protein